MKAFSFLGRGQLHETTYVYQEQTCRTRFFPEAVVQFFKPDTLILLATARAAQEPVLTEDATGRLTVLQNQLGERTRLVHVPIPEGENEGQLWDIFNIVVEHIRDSDRLIFDITHGFRSLPFLTFLALAYVRKVHQNVEIERVVYGAFDAVERDNPQKPVFDLTPFVGLLDWMGAVSTLQQSGDARPIAGLLKAAQDEPRRLGLPGQLPTQLTTASRALQNLSEALLTNRTLDAQVAAAQLPRRLFAATDDVIHWAQPFQSLMSQIETDYTGFALENPSNPLNDRESHIRQHKQIGWYVKNQQYLQAVTLMREWLISWTCLQLKLDWLKGDDRDKVEAQLGNWGSVKHKDSPFRNLIEVRLEHGEMCIDLWQRVSGLRNDLAHCGMPTGKENLRKQSDKRKASSAIRQVHEAMDALNALVKASLT